MVGDQLVVGGRPPGIRADRAIRTTTVIAVALVAAVAAFVSYRHMRGVALQYGEDAMTAAVLPFSVDGLLVAASMTMLADRRAGRRRSWLSYALLALGAAASLAANVLHAEPTTAARIIAGWPPLALLGSYELLMRQIHPAGRRGTANPVAAVPPIPRQRDQAPAADVPAPPTADLPAPPTADLPAPPSPADGADPAVAAEPADDLVPDGGGAGPGRTGQVEIAPSAGSRPAVTPPPDPAAETTAKREAILRALDQTGGRAAATVAMLAEQGVTVSKSWVYQVRKDTRYADVDTGPLALPAHRPRGAARGRRRGMAPDRPFAAPTAAGG